MRKLVLRIVFLSIPFLLLLFFTRINYEIWPFTWPDEALFSSPAATLAQKGIFATPVLDGLIPGMERATLWNSPLYMIMLAGIYFFTGEELIVGRTFSLLLACFALIVFFRLTGLLLRNIKLRLCMTALLACDLTFNRAANTIRMDMLALMFFLLSLFFLIKGLQERLALQSKSNISSKSKLFSPYFFAGFFSGLTGLSHPAAIMLIPIAILFAVPSSRVLISIAAGAVLPMLTWLFYIIPNFFLFRIQFLSQIARKFSMLQIGREGDTGGILVVFSSQYGGTFPVMMAIILLLIFTVICGLYYLLRLRKEARKHIFFFIYATFILVLLQVLIASEAWYALYVGPPLLMVTGYLWEMGRTREKVGWLRLPLIFTTIFFIFSFVLFSMRHHIFFKTPEKIEKFNRKVLNSVSGCESVYLRLRPDPYFLIKKKHPKIELLEFIPGKLRFSGLNIENRLINRYQGLDCFLLDNNYDWEPVLKEFLTKEKINYNRILIETEKPLENVTLWRRKINND